MTDIDLTVSADDIADLNRSTVSRAAAFTRLLGTAVLVVGVIGLVAYLWVAVRQQQTLDDNSGGSGFGLGDGGLSLVERIDVFSQTIAYLLWSALVVGAGTVLRLTADYAVARTGGSLTGFQVGDEVPADDENEDGEPTT
ncbi:MAG TPA: hypothetical protein VGJ86_05265 [Acidimicrobiales bacterium]